MPSFLRQRPATPAIPARGRIGRHEVATTVDAEIARYFLESYLGGARTDPAADARIDAALRSAGEAVPSSAQLRELAAAFSVDFAALCLARAIEEDPRSREIRESFCAELASTLTGAPLPPFPGYLVLFVPGFLYRYDPESGADFRRARDILTRFGLDHVLVDIDQVGPVEANARVLADEIRRQARAGRQLVLVGASSANAAIALCLGDVLASAEQDAVRAWVNIGGILRGTERADAALRWPRRWLSWLICRWKGFRYDALPGYTTRESRARCERLHLPPGLLVVNYVGIPLSGQVTERAWRGYLSLRAAGPNDGLTPIADALVSNSPTIAKVGVDHYFRDPSVEAETVALARTVLGKLEARA